MPQVKWGKKPDGTVIACSHRGHPNGYEDHCGYYQKEKKKGNKCSQECEKTGVLLFYWWEYIKKMVQRL